MAHPFSARRCMTAIVMLIALARNAGAIVTLGMVTVGDLGNAKDSTGFGSVSYEYQIGKYEVTIGQYAEFLNAVAKTDTHGLYSPLMGSDKNIAGIARTGSSGAYVYEVQGPFGYIPPIGADSPGDRPISYVSWLDAARFANWMTNGQGTGGTETGAYTLAGVSGTAPLRNYVTSSAYFIPTEDEWYKAAYYSPVKTGTGSYYLYATQSDAAPGNTIGSGTNNANYFTNSLYSTTQSSPNDPDQNYLTNVGAFTSSDSYYETFDQSGNASEWTVRVNGAVISRGGYSKESVVANISKTGIITGLSLTSEQRRFGFRLTVLPSGTTPPGVDPDTIVIDVPAGGNERQSENSYPRLASGTLPALKIGSGTFTLDQASTRTGVTTVGEGTLVLGHPQALLNSRLLPMAGGTVSVGVPQATVAGLAVTAGGLIDVGLGLLTVTGGLSAADVLTAIRRGRGEQRAWTGVSGITSSEAARENRFGATRSVGWLVNGDGSLTFGYAAVGDTNLDGQVDVRDAANILAGGKFNGTTGGVATWAQGDFNYDGIVDILDVAEFMRTGLYGQHPGNPLPGANGATVAVPEPSGLAEIAAILGILGCWRLRRPLVC